MKQIITVLVFLAITTSAFTQEPINKRASAHYTEWNSSDSLSVEKDIIANMIYIGDYNFLIKVMVQNQLTDRSIDTTQLDLHAIGPIRYYDGQHGIISLRSKRGDVSYMLIKKNVGNDEVIYYLYAQNYGLTKTFKLPIKDPFIIRLINFLLEPEAPIFRPTGTTKL